MTDKTAPLVRTALIVAVLFGAYLRLGFITYGIPYLPHPDEMTNIGLLQSLVASPDLNPHFFRYPPFFFTSICRANCSLIT